MNYTYDILDSMSDLNVLLLGWWPGAVWTKFVIKSSSLYGVF